MKIEDISEPNIRVVICEFGTVEHLKSRVDPTVTGWTQCGRCDRGVLLHGNESAQVVAGTLHPLCIMCADEIAAEHPEAFDPSNLERPAQ